MDNVKQFFKDYPNDNVVFATSDKLLFRQDGDAALHAKSLKAKNITTHLREVVMAEAETETIPVIDKVVTHTDVAPAGENKETVTAQSLQPPVTSEVKEQLNTAEKATGEVVTDTSTGEAAKTEPDVKEVATATGEGAANTAAQPASTKAEKAAAKAAAKAAEK